jgi:hypothetical protein
MALEFPHVEVLGIDLRPGPTEDTPPNCSFRVHDITAGLSQFHGMYDLIHCRFTAWTVWNFVLSKRLLQT